MSLKRKTLDALKAKEELKALDEKILGRIAAIAVKTEKVKTEDEIQSYVEDLTLNEVISTYADSRSTEATQHSVENYEKKYGLKDGKSLTTKESKGDDDDDIDDDIDDGAKEEKGDKGKKGEGDKGNQPDTKVPKYVKDMMDQMKAMTTELATLKSERTATTREETFSKAIAEADPKTQERLKRDYKRMNFKDEEDFNAYLEEIQDDIDDSSDATGAAGTQQAQNTFGIGGKSTIIGAPKGGTKSATPTYNPDPAVLARVKAREGAKPISNPIQGLTTQNQ